MPPSASALKNPTQSAVNILGVQIDALTISQVLVKTNAAINDRIRLKIGVVNAAKIVNMQRDPVLAQDVKSSDIILADGTAIVWVSRLFGTPLPERVAGIDLMYALFQQGCRVFCLGASEDISVKVEQKLISEYPQVKMVARRNGYFSEEEEENIIQKINESKPDVLLVAISSPKKERFMARWASKLEVPVIHGVGGSFDVFSGKVKRAPVSWQQHGLEWLYRLCQEPRRMWKRYLVTNSLFIWKIMQQFIRNKFRRPEDK